MGHKSISIGDMVKCPRLGPGYFEAKGAKGSGSTREVLLVIPGKKEGEWIFEAHCSVDVKTAIENAKARKAKADQIGRR